MNMDKTEYDRIITDFYSKTFLEISLREGVNYASKDSGKILNQFLNSFNDTLASNFLTRLHQEYPGLEDKVANYPEHFWDSEQSEQLLREKLHHLTGKLLGHDTPAYTNFGAEPVTFTPLNLVKFINVSLQVGKSNFVAHAVDEFGGAIAYFEKNVSNLLKNEDTQKTSEKAQRNIRELKASIEWDLKDPKNDYSAEVKQALHALQVRLNWQESKEKNNETPDIRKPKI
jgi:hypothetical protein